MARPFFVVDVRTAADRTQHDLLLLGHLWAGGAWRSARVHVGCVSRVLYCEGRNADVTGLNSDAARWLRDACGGDARIEGLGAASHSLHGAVDAGHAPVVMVRVTRRMPLPALYYRRAGFAASAFPRLYAVHGGDLSAVLRYTTAHALPTFGLLALAGEDSEDTQVSVANLDSVAVWQGAQPPPLPLLTCAFLHAVHYTHCGDGVRRLGGLYAESVQLRVCAPVDGHAYSLETVSEAPERRWLPKRPAADETARSGDERTVVALLDRLLASCDFVCGHGITLLLDFAEAKRGPLNAQRALACELMHARAPQLPTETGVAASRPVGTIHEGVHEGHDPYPTHAARWLLLPTRGMEHCAAVVADTRALFLRERPLDVALALTLLSGAPLGVTLAWNSGGKVRLAEHAMTHELWRAAAVVPSLPRPGDRDDARNCMPGRKRLASERDDSSSSTDEDSIRGGLLLEAVKGVHADRKRFFADIDHTMMYPSLVLEHDICVGAPGGVRVLPRIAERGMVFRRRMQALHKSSGAAHWAAAANAAKIFLAATCFGVLGVPRTRYCSTAAANAIVARGRERLGALRDAHKDAVVYGHTDGCVLALPADVATLEAARAAAQRIAAAASTAHCVVRVDAIYDALYVRANNNVAMRCAATGVVRYKGLECVRYDFSWVAARTVHIFVHHALGGCGAEEARDALAELVNSMGTLPLRRFVRLRRLPSSAGEKDAVARSMRDAWGHRLSATETHVPCVTAAGGETMHVGAFNANHASSVDLGWYQREHVFAVLERCCAALPDGARTLAALTAPQQ